MSHGLRHRCARWLVAVLACAAGLGLAPMTRGLLSPNPTERAQFVRGVERMTDDAVVEAIRVLERYNWFERDSWITRESAIKTLGHLRAESGVDVLMQHRNYRSPLIMMTESRRLHPGDYHPALQALVDIGPAAANRIAHEFCRFSELSGPEQEKLFWVLYQIEGRHPGCFLIERELAHLEPGPDNDNARAELTQALARFGAYDPHIECELPLYMR